MPAQTDMQRDQLAKSLIPLVHDLANQLARRLPSHVMVDDLIGAGMLGLAGAINRYDPQRAETFRGYAEFRIRGEMMDELRRRDMMSRDARVESKRIQRTIDTLTAQRGREVSDEEVAAGMELSLEQYHSLQARVCATKMICAEDISIAIEDEKNPCDLVDAGQTRTELVAAIEDLPERPRLVLWLFYFEELPLREIADLLNVTPSRVCQIRAEAVDSIRSKLEHHSRHYAA